MKRTRLTLMVAASLAVSAFLGTTTYGQLQNPEFTMGLSGWTVTGTNTVVPGGYTGTPLNLGSAPGSVFFNNGAVIISSGPTAGLVASGLSQTFKINAPPPIPTNLKGVGRLQMSNFGGFKPVATTNLSFDYRFLSNEGAGFPDYVRAELNGTALSVLSGANPVTSGPGAFGFGRSSPVVHVSQDITALLNAGSAGQTLSFFGSDTIDSFVDSAMALLDPQLTITYSKFVVEDIDAINSVYASGLPTVLAQRQILLNVAFNANRDVNARIFRLRAEADLRPEGSAGPSGYSKDGKESKKEIVPEEKRWAFFAAGAYGYRDENNVNLTAGFSTDLFTATVGGEYKITPALTIGLAASRVESDNDLGSLGKADIEGWSFDGYVSYAANHFYADLLYALGTYNHQIERNTGFLGQTATARPDSLTNSIQFNTGYNIPVGRFLTGPLASANWVHGDIDGYNEQQGGNADLSVPQQHVDSLTSELGWQLSVPIHTGFGSITPQVRSSWVHEYLNTSKQVTVGLSNSPYYLVNGASVSRFGGFTATGGTSAAGDDYMSLGAGVAFEIGDRATVVVDWETRFFQAHSSSQNVSLTGQIKF